MGRPHGKPERNREIYQLRMNSELTYREIGERYGVCTERVRQICVRVARDERREKNPGNMKQNEEG